jgi:ornithine carbamoyltransferase
LTDLSPTEINHLLELATQLKTKPHGQPLTGKTLALLFDKPSTRTRISFEAGMLQLGGNVINLSRQELQLGRGESIEDTANVLNGYIDGIVIRTYDHQTVVTLANVAKIPVINGLTDLVHPCQALADLLTLQETKGTLAGLKLAYVGDGNNVLHSLMQGAAITGIHLTVSTPTSYEPDEILWQEATTIAKQTGASLTFYSNPIDAVRDADAIYTDTWVSMGQETEATQRQQTFAAYQVNQTLLSYAKSDAVFLHCLPAHRGLEVSSDVIDGPQSVIWQQSENRLHTQKALLIHLLRDIV